MNTQGVSFSHQHVQGHVMSQFGMTTGIRYAGARLFPQSQKGRGWLRETSVEQHIVSDLYLRS